MELICATQSKKRLAECTGLLPATEKANLWVYVFLTHRACKTRGPDVNVIVSTGWCQPLTNNIPSLNTSASVTNAPKPISYEKCCLSRRHWSTQTLTLGVKIFY